MYIRIRTVVVLMVAILTVYFRDVVISLPVIHAAYTQVVGQKTVADRVKQYGDEARSRLRPHLDAVAVSYPPKSVVLAYFKDERRLDLIVSGSDKQKKYVRSYKATAASGVLGPKLREGDFQVPEGFYRISFLNPNSRFHLSLRVDYPNAFDRDKGKLDGRKSLGGDIMIHGKAVSIGCIAVGDPAIEELFVLASDVGQSNIDVIISPVDFRVARMPANFKAPTEWTQDLHRSIAERVRFLPGPKEVRSE